MLLELQDIKKSFQAPRGFLRPSGGPVHAVDGVSLSVLPGEHLGLVGESGCGKTTLARVILKLLPANSGRIFFGGKDITCLSFSQMRVLRKDMQMVFQDPYSSLDPRFTIRDIILEAMWLDKQKSTKEKEKKAAEMLLAVHLPEDILERFPHEFSGGERQRIAIARALAMNPRLLILDEAVSSLDVLVQERIMQLLGELEEKMGLTYFFISHNLRVVKKISKKIAVMYKGRIVEWAPARAIFENPLHSYTKQLLSAALEYRVAENRRDISLREDARLADQGGGHFVLPE